MGYYALFIIPYLMIIAVPAIILISIIVRGLTLPRGLRRGKASVCGRCSQEVAPITDEAPLPLRCPECGTRYAQGGLLTLGLAKRTRPGMFSLIASWTLLMLGVTGFAAGIAGSIAAGAANFQMNQSFTHTIHAVRTDGSAPTGIAGYEARFDGDLEFTYGSPVTRGTLALSVRPDSGPAVRVEIDPATTAWTIPATGDGGPAFDHAAALTALAAAGINTTPAYVNFEAGELSDAVDFVRTSPDQAVYGVLGNGFNYAAPTQHTHAATSWYPSSLTVTDQQGGNGTPLTFSFESDTIDANYSGNPSDDAYDGTVEFRIDTNPGNNQRALTEVLITLRPPEGWPVTILYNLDEKTGSLTQSQATREYAPVSDQEAVKDLAQAARLADGQGSYDPGLRDLLNLIEEIRKNPDAHTTPATPTYSSGSQQATANPPGDGNPDGGFESLRPASQNYNTSVPGMGTTFPIAILVALGVCFVIYALGIAGIAVRRARLYPDKLVGPQGPPNPSAVGPRLPGNRPMGGAPSIERPNPYEVPPSND